MEQKPIKLNFKIQTKDLFIFMLRHTYTSISGLFGLVLSLISFGLLFAGFAKGDDFKMLVLLVLGLMFTVINPVMIYMKAKNQALSNPIYKNELFYTLDDQGISLSVGNTKDSIEWSQVLKWNKTKGLQILYTTMVHAILLPVSAMNGQEEEVEALLREKLGRKKK